jgi:predicted Ser/Thr protein kinase
VSDRDQALADTAVSPPGVEVSPGIAGVERTATIAATSPEGVAALKAATHRQLGRYRLEKELGVGGMGIVHAAFDPELERRVAIKLILRATSDEARSRLLREARAMARLTHPNIITIYEIGSEAGRDFVTMELIDGGSLADWLRSEPRKARDILDAFIAAGRGLAAAHEAGIIHRDFKPHNVLRSTSGRIVVGDFGLATGMETSPGVASAPLEAHTALTATGSWVGTPAYMAPEQWNGGTITPATDQFAFCVALWEALAGQRPYRGDTIEALRTAVTAGPDKLSAAAIPMRLRGVLKRGLDPDPAKRWPSMAALLTALRPDRRKLYVWAAAVAGAALSTSVIVLALTRGDRQAAQDTERAKEAPNTLERRLELEGRKLGERIAAEARRQAERTGREINREIASAFRVGAAEIDIEVLRQIRRVNGNVTAPQEAIEALVEELKTGKTVRLVPLKDSDDQPLGLKAYTIRPGTFVDAIGLSNGDVVTAIDGRPVTSEETLTKVLDELSPEAETVRIEVLRGTTRVAIVVQANEEPPPVPPAPPIPKLDFKLDVPDPE